MNGIAVWNVRAPCCTFFQEFHLEMSKLFDRSAKGDEAAARLSCLTHSGQINCYRLRHPLLDTRCSLRLENEGALRVHFLEWVNHVIADIAAMEMPWDLESLTNLSL